MSILQELVAEAVRLGFDTFEVEYKNGFEEVCGLKGGVGSEMARVRSSSPEGAALREELRGVIKKERRVRLGDGEYTLRGRAWDSFGEDAFRVVVRRVPKAVGARGRRRAAGRGSS